MVIIYTTPSCASCRKAKAWLEEHQIEYVEKNIFAFPLTKEDIRFMLKNTENGFEDIISTRSKYIMENNIDIENMKFSELEKLIIENPSILRRPIIVEDNKLQVGYNEEEIRVFIPKEIRKILMTLDCEACDYKDALKKYYYDQVNS